MRVLMLPYDGHPYQDQLIHSLENQDDVQVTTTEESYTAIFEDVLRNGLYDVIHIHWLTSIIRGNSILGTLIRSIFTFLALITMGLFGIRTVWTIHNLTSHSTKYPELEKYLCAIFASHTFNELIAHSAEAKFEILDQYNLSDDQNISIIPHGHFIGYYLNNTSRSNARLELDIDENEFVYLFFGNVAEYKNVPLLLENFQSIENPDARLIVAGKPATDDIRKEVTNMCSNDDRVDCILEFIPDDEVQKFMNSADVVVIPYDSILTSGTAILAMSFAKPIIAPNIGCLKDLLNDSHNFMYEYDSQLQCNLRDALKCKKLQEFGRDNQKDVLQYSWDEIGEQTLEAYRS